MQEIFEGQTVFALRDLRGRSRAFSRDIEKHLLERFKALLRPYVGDVTELVELIRYNRVILSGSSALRFIDPAGVHSRWPTLPKDLDFYAPRSRHREIVNHLVFRENYTIAKETTFADARSRRGGSSEQSYGSSNDQISVITTLRKGSRSVDVIASTTESAIMPIFRFHCTFLMNAVTPDYVFIAYETMTRNRHGLRNPRRPLAHILRDKWERRGYTILENPAQWIPAHECRTDIFCFHTVRLSNDVGCLLWSYGVPGGNDVSDCSWGVLWRLGGPVCQLGLEDSTGMLVHLASLFDGKYLSFSLFGSQF